MTFQYLSAAAFAIGLASPIAAQDAAAPAATQTADIAVGSIVYGADGGEIGTVLAAEGGTVVLDVDERAVPIPGDAISAGEMGATINITKTDLIAQFDQQMAAFEAALDTALTAGTAVQTADGQTLGTVQEASGDAVVVDSADGPLTLPRQMMTLDNEGTLIVRATMGQIKQALSADPSQG